MLEPPVGIEPTDVSVRTMVARLDAEEENPSMSKVTPLIGLLVVLLATSGCGNSDSKSAQSDTTAWKADLADIGVHPSDWNDYVYKVHAELCDGDYDYLVTLHGVNLAAGRIGIKYACPEHLGEWDKAVASRNNYLCNTPRHQLTEEDRHEADGVCTP